MFLKKLSTAVFWVAALVPSASAATMNCTLSGLTFKDGGLGSGTFATDSTTGALLSWDTTTTGGTTLPGFHYDAASGSRYGDNVFTTNSFLITRNSPFAHLI